MYFNSQSGSTPVRERCDQLPRGWHLVKPPWTKKCHFLQLLAFIVVSIIKIKLFNRTEDKVPESFIEVFYVFQQVIDPFFYKKKSTTLKNQDFINYLKKNRRIFNNVKSNFYGQILLQVRLWMNISRSLLELTYRRLTDKLTPVIKSLNSDPTQSILEKRNKFMGGPLCPRQFFSDEL